MNNAPLTIGFIGAGNMGGAIIAGLSNSKLDLHFLVHDHHPEKLKSAPNIELLNHNSVLCDKADIVLLAVKPQTIQQALAECNGFDISRRPLFISVAAGVTVKQIRNGLGVDKTYPIVRAMPNTPCTLQMGMTGLYGEALSPESKQLAQMILESVGKTVWLEDEAQMDIVTATSGSGPAYFFYLCELLINAAVKQGLPKSIATQLVLQTGSGALAMASHSELPLEDLRKQVTSPGGTTQAGLEVLMSNELQSVFDRVIKAATDRGQALSQGLDNKVNQ